MRAVRGRISQVVFGGSSGGVGVTHYSTTPYTAKSLLNFQREKNVGRYAHYIYEHNICTGV